MDFLLQALRVDGFAPLLSAYSRAGVDLGDAIDGGAGSGGTASMMVEHLGPEAIVHAYEPFPGNHRFFEGRDDRIRLIKKALADRSMVARLSVPSTVSADSDWGRRGMTGYSSAGHLSAGEAHHDADVIVDCVRADEDLDPGRRVGFVKLDLQGGELDALRGMTGFLSRDVALAWIEYGPRMSPPALYEYMQESGFLVFDTEYMFRGEPTARATELFETSRTGKKLSSGSTVWYGFKRVPWTEYGSEIAALAGDVDVRLIQTDLCCINRNYLREFTVALAQMT